MMGHETRAETPRHRRLQPAILMVLAALAALYANAGRKFWVDEKITIGLVRKYDAVGIITELPLYQPHLPTWYLLPEFAGFELTIGISIVAFSLTALATLYLGRVVMTDELAFLSAVAVALSPFIALESSWLRMYGILWCLTTWTLYFGYSGQYWRSIATGWVAAVIHPFGLFAPVWVGVVLVGRRELTAAKLLSLVPSAVPTAVLLWVNFSDKGLTKRSTGMGHGIEPDAFRLFLTPISSLVGGPHWLPHAVFIVALSAVFLWRLDVRRHWELVAWIALPLVGITVASYTLLPVYRLKYFGLLAPAVAVLLWAGADDRREQTLIGGLLFVSTWLGWYNVILPALVARRFNFWFF